MMDTVAKPGGRRLRLGRQGEDLAAEHLKNLGLVVLSRNWRCREGELDLVVTDGRTLVVCEVKTRSTLRMGVPAEALTPEKIGRIRTLAGLWLREFRVGWCPIRFDVIAILAPAGEPPLVKHIKGAF